MSKPRVLLREQTAYDAAAIAGHARDFIESLGIIVAGKSVFVKPSFVYPSRSEAVLGIITSPQVVVGVCRALRDLGAKKVMVGESSVVGPSRVSFRSVGVLPLLEGLAEPCFLDEEDAVEVPVKAPWVQDKFLIPKVVLDSDLYISLPKIKTNMFAEVTLSVKNNLGLLRQRDRLLYHDYRLHKKLADLYKVRPPDLVISDCIVAGQGQGPLTATPVEVGLLLAGDNAVAVDVTACALTGYSPSEIEHLKLLIEAGYGPGSIGEIELDRPDLLKRGSVFKRPSTSLSGVSPKIRAFIGTEVACASGCVGLVRGAVDAYIDFYGADKIQPMNVIIGKPVAGVPDDLDPEITLVLGDCAEAHKHRGAFVPGCCPRPIDIGLVIRRILGAMEVDISPLDVMRAYTGHQMWRMGRKLSNRPLLPIENHVGFLRVLKELYQMRAIAKRHQGS